MSHGDKPDDIDGLVGFWDINQCVDELTDKWHEAHDRLIDTAQAGLTSLVKDQDLTAAIEHSRRAQNIAESMCTYAVALRVLVNARDDDDAANDT